MVLFGNVLMRVAIQFACTLCLVPILAQYVLDGMLWLSGYMYYLGTTLDDHSSIIDQAETTLLGFWNETTTWWDELLPWDDIVPNVMWTVVDKGKEAFDAIPASVWATIPLTLISTILSIILVPWSMLKIDDWFASLAEKKGKVTEPTKTS